MNAQKVPSKPVYSEDMEDERFEDKRNNQNHMRIEDGSEGENLTSTQGREELARLPEVLDEPEVPFYIDNNIEWSNALQSHDQDDEEESARKGNAIPGKGINELVFNEQEEEEEETNYS